MREVDSRRRYKKFTENRTTVCGGLDFMLLFPFTVWTDKMKCEMCHNAEAETAITKETAGDLQELYVCQACANKALRQKDSESVPPATGVPSLPLMGMIMDAAFEIVGRALNRAEPSCPVCGILRNEYRQRSRLGCPACYEAFSKELDSAIFDLHRASRHTGKAPEKAKAVWARKRLEAQLDEAVKAQRYEEAIALRDQLQKLDGPKDEKKGGPA